MVRVLTIVHQRDAGPGVFAEAIADRGAELRSWHPAEGEPRPPDLLDYDAAMTFGGAMHADEEDRHGWLVTEKEALRDLVEAGRPLLGACLGSQLLAEAAGGEARRARRPEIGWHDVELTEAGRKDPVIGGLPAAFEAFQWHSYEAVLPPEAVALARSPVCLQAYRLGSCAWGIQFHAEVAAEGVLEWIRDYRSDEDAVRIGVDPVALARATEQRIEAWNSLGRALCERFLAVAAGA